VEVAPKYYFSFCSSAGEDHLSPPGTIERARQAIESASRSIIANRAKKDSNKDDNVFVENGSLKRLKKGILLRFCICGCPTPPDCQNL